MGSLIFLLFRNHQLALLGCAVLLMCLYPADRNHTFDEFWLAHYVGIGETLGAQAAITVAGMLLATVLLDTDTSSVSSRVRFTVLFVGGCAAGAFLLHGLYGINKNSATPSWCLWACAITALVWLILYFVSDVWRVGAIARPLALAGVNVFLAYLISEMVPSLLEVTHLNGWYSSLAWSNLGCAVARSAGCALAILCVTAGLNRVGFRLKL